MPPKSDHLKTGFLRITKREKNLLKKNLIIFCLYTFKTKIINRVTQI